MAHALPNCGPSAINTTKQINIASDRTLSKPALRLLDYDAKTHTRSSIFKYSLQTSNIDSKSHMVTRQSSQWGWGRVRSCCLISLSLLLLPFRQVPAWYVDRLTLLLQHQRKPSSCGRYPQWRARFPCPGMSPSHSDPVAQRREIAFASQARVTT